MTAAEVTEALVSWEERLRALGAGVVGHLRPGLSRQQVEDLAGEFGVRLTQDAVAVWMWHDGDCHGLVQVTASPPLIPYRHFWDLRTALEQSRRTHELLWEEDALEEPVDHAFVNGMFRKEWVCFLSEQLPTVIDCTDSEVQTSTTAMFMPGFGLGQTTHHTIPERVGWWHWALDTGAWQVTADGGWAVDQTRYPAQVVGMRYRDALA